MKERYMVDPEDRSGISEFSHVKDSGQREDFKTGSRRDTREGKGRFDLISTIFLKRLARHYENGAKKYGDRNWEKGQNLTRYLDSAFRHLICVLEGKTDEDHESAVAWNIGAFMHTKELIERGVLPKELDDMPHYEDWENEPLNKSNPEKQ